MPFNVPFHLKITLHFLPPPPQKKMHEQNLSQSNDTIDYCVHVVVGVTCVLPPKYPLVQVPWKSINVCGYSDQLCIFWTLGGQFPQMTLDDLWVGSHVCPYHNILLSKSNENSSTCVDTVKIYAHLDHLGSMTSNDHKMTFDFHFGEGVAGVPLPKYPFCPSAMKIHQTMWKQWGFWLGLTLFCIKYIIHTECIS